MNDLQRITLKLCYLFFVRDEIVAGTYVKKMDSDEIINKRHGVVLSRIISLKGRLFRLIDKIEACYRINRHPITIQVNIISEELSRRIDLLHSSDDNFEYDTGDRMSP